MDLVDGEDICLFLEKPLGAIEALEVILKCAKILEQVHAKGIIHRDIKPGNIMLKRRENGQIDVTIVDFGYVCFELGE